MNRRNFLIGTGMLIPATYFSFTTLTADNTGDAKERKPNPDDFDKPILKAIAFGMSAPNPHNGQAWKFKLVSETEMLFYVDEKRVLPQTDPTYRQIHIGCGCFLGALTIGMSSLQYEAVVQYLPEGEYKDMSDIGKKPIAKVKLINKKDIQIDGLYRHLYERRTNRLKYHGDIITNNEFKSLLEIAKPKNTLVSIVNDEAILKKQLDILEEGMIVETNTYNKHEESRIWFRENDRLIKEKRDGLNLPSGGTKGINKVFAEWFLKGNTPEKWHSERSTATFLSNYKEAVESSKGVVLMKTSDNTLIDWMNTGVDYIRFQLACQQFGFYIHPMSQVLQEYEEMKELALQFNQFNQVKDKEKIQMAVRIGRAAEPYTTFRRNLKDLLV